MDGQQFAQHVAPYQRLMFHVAYAMLHNQADCADAVQDALLNAWRHQAQLREDGVPKAWLMRILVNTCNDLLRKRKRAPLQLLDTIAAPTVDHLPLHDALERLDASLRLPLVLHYLEGFSVAEIAESLDLPIGTVKTRMMRARNQLQIALGGEEESTWQTIAMR